MLITPTAKSSTISAQQQPMHQAPCTIPIRTAPAAPSRQWCITKPSGVRHLRRHARLTGVS